MRAKKLHLKDTYTHIPVVVLQFEAVDEDFCKQVGIGTDLKVIIKFTGKRAACIAGYRFSDKYETLEEKVLPLELDGTIGTLAIILDQVNNIQHLPDVLDVEETRLAMNAIEHPHILHEHIREVLDDYRDHDVMRKVIYYNYSDWTAVAIIDIEQKQMVFQMSSTDRDRKVAAYLWIPLEPATMEELDPFKEELDFKRVVM